jgi:hypothetical protein
MQFPTSRLYLTLVVLAGSVLLLAGLNEARRAAEADDIAPTTAVFKAHCRLSHTASDDPLLHPGMPGMSHLHDFFGNQSVDADTTTASLAAASSTCAFGVNELDHSAYWFPALLKNGAPVDTTGEDIEAYYRGADSGETVTPFPYGLRMIAGDMMATSPQLPYIADFGCSPPINGAQGAHTEIPTCPPGRYASGKVTFPSCWDGVHLDSADHKSHMAYSLPDKGCPESHPVRVPELTLRVGWETTVGTYGAEYELASGGQYTLHADFWNGWAPTAMRQLVDKCLNVRTDCTEDVRPRVTGEITFPAGDEPVDRVVSSIERPGSAAG